MKKIFLFLLCFFPALIYAKGNISRVSFTKGHDVITINYYMYANKMYNVQVFLNQGDSLRLLHHVTGDVGKIRGEGYKKVVLDRSAEFGDEPLPEDLKFTVVGDDAVSLIEWPYITDFDSFYFSLEYACSFSAPFGFGFAFFSNWGGYTRLKVSLTKNFGIEIEEPDNVYLRDDTKKRYYRQSYTAGVVRRVSNHIWIYGGLGYGEYAPIDKVPEVTDFGYSYNKYYWNKPIVTGVELEIGLMFNFDGFFLSVGYGTIAGKTMPFLPNVGISAGYVIEL